MRQKNQTKIITTSPHCNYHRRFIYSGSILAFLLFFFWLLNIIFSAIRSVANSLSLIWVQILFEEKARETSADSEENSKNCRISVNNQQHILSKLSILKIFISRYFNIIYTKQTCYIVDYIIDIFFFKVFQLFDYVGHAFLSTYFIMHGLGLVFMVIAVTRLK